MQSGVTKRKTATFTLPTVDDRGISVFNHCLECIYVRLTPSYTTLDTDSGLSKLKERKPRNLTTPPPEKLCGGPWISVRAPGTAGPMCYYLKHLE